MSTLKIKDNGVWKQIPTGGEGVPAGGTANQLMTKSSSVDYATQWSDPEDVGIMPFWDLLWVNASPTSSFSAQDVPLDLSAYDIVVIIYRTSTGDTSELPVFCLVGSNSYLYAGYPSGSSPYVQTRVRAFQTSTSNIHFDNGLHGYPVYGYSDNDPAACVPYKIFGVKGVSNS